MVPHMLASSKYPDRQIHRDLKEQLYYDVMQYFDQGKASLTVVFVLNLPPQYSILQCESKKSPPKVLSQFFQNGSEFFNQILHAYYAFLSTLDYKCLFNYLQLWRSYAILSVTTQFTSGAQNVNHRPKRTLAFSDIFPNG